MRTGGVGEGLDFGHEDWRIGRRIGRWKSGLEGWEKNWTLEMRTGGVGEGLDCVHKEWRRERKIERWA